MTQTVHNRTDETPTHPGWCVTDEVGPGGIVAHCGPGLSTVKRTPYQVAFTMALYAPADRQEPRGYGATYVELTIDPGDEFEGDSPTMVLLDMNTAEVLGSLLTDLLEEELSPPPV